MTCPVCDGDQVVTGVLTPGAFTDDPSGQTWATIYCPNSCHRGTVPAGPQAHLAAMPAQPDTELLRAVQELLEVAALRGDSTLPAPPDDPLDWTARMQTAWDDVVAAVDHTPLTKTEKEAAG